MSKKKPVEATIFTQYKKEVIRLLALAQIGGDWDITFAEEELDGSNGMIEFCTRTRYACFYLDVEMCKETDQCPLSAARHEFGHFVTAQLIHLATDRYVTESDVREAGEAVARTFETMFATKDK